MSKLVRYALIALLALAAIMVVVQLVGVAISYIATLIGA
jgi:hypothetical protein